MGRYFKSVAARILKDKGYNTDVVNKTIIERPRNFFRTIDQTVLLPHSKKTIKEVAKQVLVDAKLTMKDHIYSSNLSSRTIVIMSCLACRGTRANLHELIIKSRRFA